MPMCWSASMRTGSSSAPVMPRRRSSRMTRRSGGRKARRCAARARWSRRRDRGWRWPRAPASHRPSPPRRGSSSRRRRDVGEGAHLFALDHHVQIMGGEAAALEPGLAPDVVKQRREEAEVGRSLDRTGAEAELLGHGVVMDRDVAAILLLGQHLARGPQRSAQGEGGGETQKPSPLAVQTSTVKV